MDFLGAEHEVHEGQAEQVFHLVDRPVVSQCRGAHPAPLSVDLHEFCGCTGMPAGPNLPGMVGSRESIVNRWGQMRLTAYRGLSRWLAATLFPPRCCLCGFPGASLDLDLCPFCHGDLPWHAAMPEEVIALRFEPPVDELIRQLKYQGVIANARVLGVLLAQVARSRDRPLPRL